MEYLRKMILAAALLVLTVSVPSGQVFAAEVEEPLEEEETEAYVHFGSASYVEYEGQLFNIGLYIESAVSFGEYSLTMTYDPAFMEYVSGAVSGGDGQATISGVADGGYVKALVQFRALAAGDMTLALSEAYVQDTDGIPVAIVNQGAAPLTVRVDESVYLEGIRIGGEEIETFAPEILEYDLTVPYETDHLDLEAVGNEAEVSGQDLEVGENTVSLRLRSAGGTETVYVLHVIREQEVEEPETVLPEIVPDAEVPELAETTDTVSEDVQQQTEIAVPSMEYETEKAGMFGVVLKQKIIYMPFLITVIFVFAISSVVEYTVYAREIEWEKRRNRSEQRKRNKIRIIDYDDIGEKIRLEEPVIVVDDICMDFKVAMQNVSGIKEWIIKKIKGKISYRMLHALSHISFKVYPKEVVGIIGTNGSGKSTLLKIISGALTPTAGSVAVDRNKIQILTLGTGFDMELTAKENVYLNGAIIGYSREFIDEHYDEIVEFAELSDFMEEKVKNFSSGMVSRLGFAIATAGDAAEILILDEVLSVGDEFFRKKSLARIKEMIHGGSTVLMVSHGMATIRENCTKVIWIEKGKLRMAGNAKEVCQAYQSME